MDGACSTHGREDNTYTIVVGKPGGKRPLGRSGLRWKRNGNVWGWICLVQDMDQWRALVNTGTNLRVP